MIFYKTLKWQRQRARILRRDEYLCRECRRYGRSTAATTVHHIIPHEEAPSLALVGVNLISLCHACHDSMHDRTNGELSELGRAWVDRMELSPPTLRLDS